MQILVVAIKILWDLVRYSILKKLHDQIPTERQPLVGEVSANV
jgi:hypothetical protein